MRRIKEWVKQELCKFLAFSYVFMFHHVSDNLDFEKSACKLGFDDFKSFILRYNGNYVSFMDVAAKKCKRKVSITFDDGLSDVYTLAYPFLNEHQIPFTIFVVTDFLDTEGYITTTQLLEMSRNPLVTIGSHGVTHRIFPKLDRENKIMELTESKRILSDLIGRDVNIFAYSHGQYDQETLALMSVYDYAVAAGACCSAHLKANRFLIPRYNITTRSYKDQLHFFDRVLKTKK